MSIAKRTERGWAGHYIQAKNCLFRRNTLVEYDNKRIVVSTVGARYNQKEDKYEPINLADNRLYETMTFEAELVGETYFDADVTKQIKLDSPWVICGELSFDSDYYANLMHEKVVEEIMNKIKLI
jgi:hypothetical protein